MAIYDGGITERCGWYTGSIAYNEYGDWYHKHDCDLYGPLKAAPNYLLCNNCKSFKDRDTMKDELLREKKCEVQGRNKDKWEINWE